MSTRPAASQSWADLEARLAQGRKDKALYQAATTEKYPVHISPWIEKTGWATYLKGYSLHKVAQLLDRPSASEPGLTVLHSAFDALIEDARKLVLEGDQINTFTLHRVNSFIPNRHFKRPLLTKLVDGTYRKYKAVWRKLLGFVYRLTVLHQAPNLHYKLTPQQQEALANLPPSITAALPLICYPTQAARSAPPLPVLSPIRLRSSSRGQHLLQTPPPSSPVAPQDSDRASYYDDDDSGSEYNPPLPSSPGRSTLPTTEGGDSPTRCASPVTELGVEPESAQEIAEDTAKREQLACLDLCISLLDHKIMGRLTDSIMVAFLAANGINKDRTGFEEAVTATSELSGLVKMAQLLVLRSAVHEHHAGQAEFPSDKVAELQDRFMVFGSNSPINWILNLRAYGAVIRNNTTAAGWIEWSDDGQKLTYKAMELTLNGLRWAVRDQISLAQEQLSQLLLLPDSEPDTRARLVPKVTLAQLKDDPGVFTADHCFLQDPRNKEAIQEGSKSYMLNRIRDAPKLRQRFFLCEETLAWNPAALQKYIRRTYHFLERLLLLIHMTGGQPARGTELLTLRWRNSSQSDIRSIFVDNGMLSFVTSYHKNYSTSSTTRIIHRFLPPEIGELLLYYLWLIAPFLDALHILTEGQAWQAPDIGSYLWPDSLSAVATGRKIRITGKGKKRAISKSKGGITHHGESMGIPEQPWPSSLLGQVIKRELGAALSTTVTILLWRHGAIAMSRKHLPEGV